MAFFGREEDFEPIERYIRMVCQEGDLDEPYRGGCDYSGTALIRNYAVEFEYYARTTALVIACAYGHADAARRLIQEAGSRPWNEHDDLGDTPLLKACAAGHFGVVRVLFNVAGKSYDVGNQRNKAGDTALLIACYKGHSDIARWLVDEGWACARTERNCDGDTALMLACHKGRLELVHWLLTQAGSSAAETNHVCMLCVSCSSLHGRLIAWLGAGRAHTAVLCHLEGPLGRRRTSS